MYSLLRAMILLTFCWLAMMWIHEAGHALATVAAGGHVQRVVLSPIAFSRTDVSQNPSPITEVWAGPIFGALAPVLLAGSARLISGRSPALLPLLAGFCLIANGGYLLYGVFDPIGDANTILTHGGQRWHLLAFGLPATASGLALWHTLGSRLGLIGNSRYTATSICIAASVAVVLAALGAAFFPA